MCIDFLYCGLMESFSFWEEIVEIFYKYAQMYRNIVINFVIFY